MFNCEVTAVCHGQFIVKKQNKNQTVELFAEHLNCFGVRCSVWEISAAEMSAISYVHVSFILNKTSKYLQSVASHTRTICIVQNLRGTRTVRCPFNLFTGFKYADCASLHCFTAFWCSTLVKKLTLLLCDLGSLPALLASSQIHMIKVSQIRVCVLAGGSSFRDNAVSMRLNLL